MTRTSLALVALLLAAACQPETTETAGATGARTATTPSSPDVCSMMTMDELNTAAGLTSATGQSSQTGGADVCTWTGENGRSVVVEVSPAAGQDPQARLGGTAVEVSGVGDRAFFSGDTLVAQKGSKIVRIQVPGGSQAEATAIAHVILSRV